MYENEDIPDNTKKFPLAHLLSHLISRIQCHIFKPHWMHLAHHHVYAHYGVRTHQYKLIYYYADGLNQTGSIEDTKEPEWELFDLEKDPYELNSVYNDPEYADIVRNLKDELHRLQENAKDERYVKDVD